LKDAARNESPAGALAAGASPEENAARLADRLGELAVRLEEEVGRIIVGQDQVVEEMLLALLAGGNAILEGVPGLAKTLLVNTLASALSLQSGRIQFTPDLMPSDVTGTLVMQEAPGGGRGFAFRRGPIFVNMLLADEINRTPPKTQSALLEGMSEGQVTAGGRRHALPRPFFVLATQNPIEQEGTYPLPEAQLDRFLFKIVIDYPSFEEEWQVIERTTGTHRAALSPAVSREEILALQRLVRSLPASQHIQEYATRLARRSRPSDPRAPAWVRQLVAWGAGPRAAQSLILAAKARTLLDGRFAVTRADVRAVALPVLRHRILPSFQAEGEGLTAGDLVERLLRDTPSFPENPEHDDVTRRILRL
jgi:MoxR-like ATPase